MYAVPTWGSPVGDGAMRTRTVTAAIAPLVTRHGTVVEVLPLLVASPIVGTVVSATGRTIDDGRAIVTDVVVRAADGSETTYLEPGGSADGIAQVMWPGPAIPSPGDVVSLKASDQGVIEDL